MNIFYFIVADLKLARICYYLVAKMHQRIFMSPSQRVIKTMPWDVLTQNITEMEKQAHDSKIMKYQPS